MNSTVNCRCRDLLLSAIKGEELPEGIDVCRSPATSNDKIQSDSRISQISQMLLLRCEELATNLEESIFTQFKQTNPKYKNQVVQ